MSRGQQIMHESLIVMKAINRHAHHLRAQGCEEKAQEFHDLCMGVAGQAIGTMKYVEKNGGVWNRRAVA